MIAVVAENLGAGVALIAPALVGLWAALHHRTAVIDRYVDDLPMAQAELEEIAAEELRQLADEIERVLGPAVEDHEVVRRRHVLMVEAASVFGMPAPQAFDPRKALAAPDRLRTQIARIDRLLKARASISRDFASLRLVGPVLSALVGVYLVASSLSVLYFAEVVRWRVAAYVGLWLAIAAVVAIVIVLILYALLIGRFDKVKMLRAATFGGVR